MKARILAIIILLVGMAVGFFDLPQYYNKLADKIHAPHLSVRQFRLGLDLQGGTHLVYRADISSLPPGQVAESMQGLRDVIERRVNAFGVAEPLVQINRVGSDQRLIVELAGVYDINQAIQLIGETPFLQFKTERPEVERDAILEAQKNNQRLNEDAYYIATDLTGKYLQRAELVFDQKSFSPTVSIVFNDEGGKLFETLTAQNVGKPIAIYLDGLPISTPMVREKISGGSAQITGDFTADEARQLVQRFNSGALPVPISLLSQQRVEASLGRAEFERSLAAGMYGLLAVALFMLFWYRLPGFVAGGARLLFPVLTLAVFKLFSITLTAAGMAGFILSIGMAVDANILIFERFKEEMRAGRPLGGSIDEGFARAWLSIRDSNVSSLITSVILFWFCTSLIKGFALTLGIGILVSMFSAITLTRTFLRALNLRESRAVKFLFGV